MNKLIKDDLVALKKEITLVENFLNSVDEHPEQIFKNLFYNNEPYNLIFKLHSANLHKKMVAFYDMLKKIPEFKDYKISYDTVKFVSPIILSYKEFDFLKIDVLQKTYQFIFDTETQNLETSLMNTKTTYKNSFYKEDIQLHEQVLKYLDIVKDNPTRKECEEFIDFVYDYYIIKPSGNFIEKMQAKSTIAKSLERFLNKIEKECTEKISHYKYMEEKISTLEKTIHSRYDILKDIQTEENKMISYFNGFDYKSI